MFLQFRLRYPCNATPTKDEMKQDQVNRLAEQNFKVGHHENYKPQFQINTQINHVHQ